MRLNSSSKVLPIVTLSPLFSNFFATKVHLFRNKQRKPHVAGKPALQTVATIAKALVFQWKI
jgi:hypothetical protein